MQNLKENLKPLTFHIKVHNVSPFHDFRYPRQILKIISSGVEVQSPSYLIWCFKVQNTIRRISTFVIG